MMSAEAAEDWEWADSIASRVAAIADLVRAINEIESDEDIKKEVISLIRAVRLTIKTLPQGDLRIISTEVKD